MFKENHAVHSHNIFTLEPVAGGRVVSALDCYAHLNLASYPAETRIWEIATSQHAGCQEVGRCHTRNECQEHTSHTLCQV